MSVNQREVATAVANKLQHYLETQRNEADSSSVNTVDLKACRNYKKTMKEGQSPKAQILSSEIRSMRAMSQLTDRELASKKKLEIQLASKKNPFMVSPYACPVVEGEKRLPKFTKKTANKRILSVNRTQSAKSRNRQPINSPAKTEREQILNLTAKLLVATETVALPKNRQQSRECQTNTEERFPSIPTVPRRTKSSYSDPGIHTLTKEHVEKLNSLESNNKQFKDGFDSADGGSFRNQRVPFQVENCNRGYVIRKKPASYPSSLTSQNSRFVSPLAQDFSHNFTIIKDKEDIESFDDNYFDREFPGISVTPSDWLEESGEKQHADTSTQTIQDRGTQTSKKKSIPMSGDAYVKNQSHMSTDVPPRSQHLDGLSDSSENEVADMVDCGRIMSIKTQTNFEPRVRTYQVYVITGDVAGASTTSDVKINIFGELGDSGDRCLLKSKTSKIPFLRGQLDVFDLDCKYLGKLSNIRIGHNGTTQDAGWYVDKVFIRAGQKAKKAYTFSCEKWLSAKEGDGQIMRDVTLSEAIPASKLPPILPRRTMHRKTSSEESEMSEKMKTKVLKSKGARDKMIKDKYQDTRRPSDEKSGHHKQRKMDRNLSSSSSSDSVSSSSDSEMGKQKKTKQKHSHRKTKREIGKENMPGTVDSITDKTKDIELDSSTDTSVSSYLTSPHANKLYDETVAQTKRSKSFSNMKTDETVDANSSPDTNNNLSDLPSPNTHTRKVSFDDKPLQKNNKKKKKSAKKSSKTNSAKTKELVTESPLHYKDISVVESIAIPQEDEMILGINNSSIPMSPQNSEDSSMDSLAETKTKMPEDTEEEKFEFTCKDTKKLRYKSEEEDDLYMAGFRAGIDANKEKHRDKDLKEKDAFQEKVKNGPTVHEACEDGDVERLKDLVDSVPDLINKVDERGWAPIHISAAFGHLNMLKWLTISGVNLSDETHTGYTAIHLAAMNGHVNCIMILSAMGCSISSCTVDGFTPLHLAAMSGHIECVKWLLSNRAKIDAKDTNGRTPLDLAVQFQHEDCENLLRIFSEEVKRKGSVVTLLRDPNALRRNSADGGTEHQNADDSGHHKNNEEDQGWISDASDVSSVVGRGGDNRPENQRTSTQSRRKGSATNKALPPRSASSRRKTKQEERQVQQLEEKKRNYEQNRRKLERRNSSFLDSIRQDIDGGGEEPDF